uniref:Hydroxyproline O-arabinosyltransferase-like domain-containing protein n=1 Tax=Tetraselmis sp. GSL018 TaxID=582737 RepID=A0A061QV19_9CHLO
MRLIPSYSRSRALTHWRLTLLAVGGALAGFCLGLIFMGTVHTMLEIRATRHYLESENNATSVESLQEQAVIKDPQAEQDTIHTICTSNGSPYVNFQTRIMYGTYLKVQSMPGGEKLVAFTRILHRTKPDVLYDEIPTFRAEPLTPACDNWCEFPVSDRPDAVEQWLKAAESDPSMIRAPWILMIETDYVWHKPLQAPRADSGALSIAFPFGYIVPNAPPLRGVMRLMYPEEKGPLSDIPNTGPAPMLLRTGELRLLVPDWKRLAAHIEAHAETKQKLGWVREMYAWSVAAALNNVKFDLHLPPKQKLIVQPPADREIGDAAMFHYTWGTVINDVQGGDKVKLWEFDKRTYTDAVHALKVPLIPEPPPWRSTFRLQDGLAVDEKLMAVVRAMIDDMNSVIPQLKDLRSKGSS